MTRRILSLCALLCALCALLTLVSCGGKDSPGAETPTTPTTRPTMPTRAEQAFPPMPAVVFFAEVEQEEELWELTFFITIEEETCIWNGNFELLYDTEALELVKVPEELGFFESAQPAFIKETATGVVYTTFVKMYGLEPGIHPVATLTFRQKGDEAGRVWFNGANAKIEDVGESGLEETWDYAKVEGGLLAPGIDGEPAVLVGAHKEQG